MKNLCLMAITSFAKKLKTSKINISAATFVLFTSSAEDLTTSVNDKSICYAPIQATAISDTSIKQSTTSCTTPLSVLALEGNFCFLNLCWIMFSSCLYIFILLFWPEITTANDESVLTLNPLYQTSTLTAQSTTKPVSGELDSQSKAILNQLRDVIALQKSESAKTSVVTSAFSESQSNALQALRRRVGKNLQVQGMVQTGIPRQIKGGILEARITQVASAEEHDKRVAQQFLTHQKALLGLTKPSEEMQLQQYDKDELGRRHLRYNQTHQGLPVWPSEAIVHIDSQGNVDAFDSSHIRTPKKALLEPVLGKAAAVEIAKNAVPESVTAQIDNITLILYAQKNQEPRLAWKMELSMSVKEDWLVVIDASNGNTLTAYNQVTDANARGAGIDLVSRNLPLNVWQENGKFWLEDTSKPMFDKSINPLTAKGKGVIEVWDAQNKPATSKPEGYPDPAPYYVDSFIATSGWVPDAVGAAYNLSEAYDYFLERHGRNSYDNKGGTITAIVRVGINWFNASWHGQDKKQIVFGDADRFSTSLDVVAHELTHAVTEYSANLIYQNQSGALNEAFSDIFGETTEARTRGANDWLIGSELKEPLRSMKNPALYNQPTKMSEFVILANDFEHDNGGVHTNSGIINHAFYLLVEGLNGGIGIRDAERIFYRALVTGHHLVQNSEFIDARRAAVLSAEEIFGAGSIQAQRTAQAFDAVEITDGKVAPNPTPIPVVNGPDSILSLYYDPTRADWFLTRRETALGDAENGRYLSSIAAAYKRPSITGDGSIGIFVSANHDICTIRTNQVNSAECLGYQDQVESIAIAPSGDLAAIVMRGTDGNPTNSVTILDLNNASNSRSLTLKTSVADGTPVAISYADALSFTPDSRLLVFDAFNQYTLANGTPSGSWSIYALNLATDQFHNVVNVVDGLDIGFPSVSHTRSDLLVFEAKSQVTGISSIYTANFNSGEFVKIGQVEGSFSVPAFNGDDTAILYSRPDSSNSGSSLYLQSLASDQLTAVGNPALIYQDRDMGVIYRRGTFVGATDFDLSIDATYGSVAISPSGSICDNKICKVRLPQDTRVTMTATPITGWSFDHWTGCDRVGGSTCSITMNSAKNVEAWFKRNENWSLSVVNTTRSKGTGTIISTPAGISCRLSFKGKKRVPIESGSCNALFPANSAVTLSIDPKTGLIMDDDPSGCDNYGGQSCIATVQWIQTRASMGLVYAPKSLLVSLEGSGKVTSTGINCGAKCFKSFPKTKITKVRLVAKPKRGWRLDAWSGCDSSNGLACTVSLYNERTVKATFKPK